MIIAILLFALIAFLSIDLIVAGLQFVFIVIWLPFIIIYQLIKLIFNKDKKSADIKEWLKCLSYLWLYYYQHTF